MKDKKCGRQSWSHIKNWGGVYLDHVFPEFFYKRRIGVLRELRDSFTVREDAVPYYRLMRYMFAVLIVHSICIEGSCSVLSCPTC